MLYMTEVKAYHAGREYNSLVLFAVKEREDPKEKAFAVARKVLPENGNFTDHWVKEEPKLITDVSLWHVGYMSRDQATDVLFLVADAIGAITREEYESAHRILHKAMRKLTEMPGQEC